MPVLVPGALTAMPGSPMLDTAEHGKEWSWMTPERRSITALWPPEAGGRIIGGLLLLLLGAGLAARGLGIDHGPVANALGLYWPLPFVAWGALGFLWHFIRGTGAMFFYLTVAAVAALVEVQRLHIAHLEVWPLFGAVLLLGFGLSVLREAAHGRRWR